MSVYEKLKAYAKHNLNVLFVGPHGIGKTSMVQQLKDELGLKYKYYSASTLDVWAELVGIPVPNHEEKTIEFYTPKELLEAEFLFFDEINRAPQRTLDAIHEIVQFKSINGKPFPHLKMVWAAMNPAGAGYNVDDLDPALYDRFHAYVNLKATFNMEYMRTKMKEDTAKTLRAWWRQDMNEEQQSLISPRRLEYIGYFIDNDIDWHGAMPNGALPNGSLNKRLRMQAAGFDPAINITKENLLAKTDVYIELAKKEPSTCIKMADVLRKCSPLDLFNCRDILEVMPKDIVHNIGKIKAPIFRNELFECFQLENIDTKKDYPTVHEAFLGQLKAAR